LGHLLNTNSQFEEAVAVFDRLIAVEPEWSGGWAYKGMVLCNLHRYADALPVLYRAVTLDPNDCGAWRTTGFALHSLGREEDAAAAWQRDRAARRARFGQDEDTDENPD
jgi:Flp pilus assembly protein TadD